MIDDTGMLYSLWNKIFSAKIINDNDIRFDETISNGEDALFVFEYLSHVQGDTVFLNKTLYSYINQNPECLSAKKPYDEMLTAEKVFASAEELFSKLGFSSTESENEFYDFYLNRFVDIIGNIINNKTGSKSKRLKESNATMQLPGFRKCLKKVDLETSCHGKLIKIYRLKIIGWLYNFGLVWLKII